jgi:TldD protein
MPAGGSVTGGVLFEHCSRVTARLRHSTTVDLTANVREGCVLEWHGSSGSTYLSADTADPEEVARFISTQTPDAVATGVGGGRVVERPELAAAASALADTMSAIDAAAREHDDRIRQVVIDSEHETRTLTSVMPDEIVSDRRHLRYLTIRAIAEESGRVGTGFLTPATSAPDEVLDVAEFGRQVAERALLALWARPAPIAHMPVVVGPGRGMVLIHEACCHPLEGDEVLRGSVYASRMGELVASRGVTITDDPLLAGGAGSYRHDDEGVPARTTNLIEDGRLVSYLTDRATGARLGVAPTGNGRRDSYRAMALPRMSNTCVRSGTDDVAAVIADTRAGLYATHVGGGEVVEATGDFVFRVLNGFLIEDGKLTDPVQETTLRGNGAVVLRDIDAMCSDVTLGAAKCGKFGQMIPVGVEGPTLRIRSLLVGGTSR